jgi:hypothetical protein
MAPNAPPGCAPSPSSAGARRFVVPVLALAIFFTLAVGLQKLAHAYDVELSGYPDEPGHFVTGVLVQDYLKALPPKPLIPFAKEFYIHRPKAAIGHWPPMLYLIEGIWFVLFHATRRSVLALMALIAASLAASISHVVGRRHGTAAGIAAGVLFISLSFIQIQTSQVMADMLVTLFGFWATISFGDFLTNRQARSILRFAAFSLLAIFTKNNGLYLALIPPIALLLTWQPGVLKNPLLWLGGAAVAIPTAIWIAWSQKYVVSTWAESPSLDFFLRASRQNMIYLYGILGPCFLILTLTGAVRAWIEFRSTHDFVWPVLTSAALSVLLFQSVAPAGIDSRFLVPAIAAIVPLVFSGLMWLADYAGPRTVPRLVRAGALLAIGILISPKGVFAIPHKAYRGFSEVADMIEAQPSLRRGAILVSSSSDGEGLLISEIVMRYPDSEGFVLRASKMLSQADWLGRGYQCRFESSDEMDKYLKLIGVDLIVIDAQEGFPELLHQTFLLKLAAEHLNDWKQVGVFPQRFPSEPKGSKIIVYQRTARSDQGEEKLHRDMEDILRRMIGN